MIYTLDKIMKQVRGVSYNKSDASLTYKEGFVPVLRAGNIQNSRIIHDDFVYIPKEGVKNVQLLKKGDVLIAASSGSISIVGKAAMILQDMNAGFGAFCKVLRPNKEIVNEDYFKFYFETPHYKNSISQLAEGANINNLKTEHFDNLEIYLPPLPQQQKIANILDAADALRQNDKALIAKYDELTQALFLDMFGDPVSNPKGWAEKSLYELCNKITDGTHDTPLRLTEGIKFITGKHIRPFVIDYDNSDYVTEEVHNEIYRRCNPEYGDILYTNIGVNFATAAMNTVDYEFSMKNVALLKYKREFLNGRFLESILNNEFFKDRLKRAFGIGGAQQFLSLSNIKSIMILNPPLELQNQFAKRVAVIEEQKATAQKSLEHSERLFNSLLQKAFKGELV
jgi:type I restriction enzyme S subunit